MISQSITESNYNKQTPALLLEHINLNIPDEKLGREFYIDVLGGVKNPKSTNDKQLHVNVGTSQFHLLLKTKTNVNDDDATQNNVTIPQCWPGYIELWTIEDLENIRNRLPPHRCYYLQVEQENQNQKLVCICPWNKNRFLIKRAPPDFSVTHQHPGGYGTLVAMHRLVHPVSTSHGGVRCLGGFWKHIMGCAISLKEEENVSNSNGAGDKYDSLSLICNDRIITNSVADESSQPPTNHRRCCIVHFESGQELILEESNTAPPPDLYDIQNDISGYHLCIYLPTEQSFKFAFQQVEKNDLLYANPRFAGGIPAFGNALNWKEASDCGQFRVKDWLWCKGYEERKSTEENGRLKVPSLVMELEVRSTRHICCPYRQ